MFKYFLIRKTLLTAKRIAISMMLLLTMGLYSQLFGQTTYTWQGANNASWAVSTNWTPTRTTPATNDILQFNTGTTLTITIVPTQTIGRFVMSNSTNITLQSAAANTLTIGNGTGTDLDIPSGSALTMGTSVNITLAASANANISGTLTVNTGRTYNTNGASSVTTVNNLLNNTGTITNATAGNLNFTSGSTYIHAQDGGTIPTATWNAASTCSVTGTAGTVPGGLGQNFGNFKWNCTGQTANINLVIGVSNAIAGTLEINSTSTFQLRLNQAALSVAQYTQTGGNFVIASSARALTVTGNVSISGGTLTMTRQNGIGTLNVAGNFSHTSGTITETGSVRGLIVFNGTQQTYTSGGTVSNTINFNVNSGSTLQMAAAGTIVSGAGTFTLSSGATLGITSTAGITTVGTATGNIRTTAGRNFSSGANYTYNGGVNQATGTGFPTNLTGTLTIDDAGFTVTLGNARTILNGGTVNIVNGVFGAGTNLTMASTSSILRSGGSMTGTPQGAGIYNVTYTGNSMTTTTELSGSGLNNVTVNLTAGQTLTLDQNRSPDGNLNIATGSTFDLSTFTANRSAAGGTLTIAGTMKLGGANNFPTNFGTMTLTGGTVEYNGLNSVTQAISVEPTYYNLVLTNGSGSGSAAKTISANISISNALTINSNTIFDLGTFTADRTSSGGTLTIAGTMKLGGSSNFPVNYTTMTFTGSTIEYNGLNSITQTISALPTYHNLTLTNGSGSGSAAKTISANITINNTFTINSNCVFSIPANTDVTVAGTLTNNAGTAGLVIKSTSAGTGSLMQSSVGVSATVERYMTGNKWHIVSSPVSGQDSSAFVTDGSNAIPTSGSNYGMMAYSESAGGWRYYTNPVSSGAIPSGSGFLVRRTSDGVVSFSGTIVNSANISISRSLNGWNCIGNPFTSAIKIRGASPADNFLGVNSDQLDGNFAALYIYDPDKPYLYQIINNTDPGGRFISQDYLQPGQAFLVRSKLTGGSLNFTPAMQLHQNSVTFYKKSAQTPWPAINLKVKSANKEALVTVLFNENMTRGLDVTFDAGLFGGDPSLNLYTRLVADNGINFAIQCLPDQETSDMIIPIGLDIPAGGLVSFTAEIVTLPAGYKAILEDRQLGIFTDLKVQGAKYDIMLPSATTGTGRFFLHTQNSLTGVNNTIVLQKIITFAVGKEIYIKGQVNDNTSVIVYDLYGRKLKTVVLEQSEMNSFRVDELMQGIYILKVSGKGVQVSNRVYIE